MKKIIIVVINLIWFFFPKKKNQAIKMPNYAVYNNPKDNSVFQVENYLKSRHKSYRPLQWWKVEQVDMEEGKYFVRHRYRADKVVYNKVFFLDSSGNVTLVK